MRQRAPGRKQPHGPRAGLWIGVLLALAVFLVYSPVLQFEFVTYDDPDYVTANAHVQAGLTPQGAVWALRSSFAGNWFPLTWLSHMLDCQIFGVDSGWHHFTSVLIHALTTVLLFLFLERITGARWRSALVAFLFALHPLHVESVAWVAERKDVLSALFWVAALWSYTAYAFRPGRGRYVLTLLLFCLGAMAKPMVVTLPAVLLLLDWWPLQRGTRVLEKIPFFAVSIALSVVTYLVHQNVGATAASDLIPLQVRLQNSLVSYVVYVLQMLWPSDLAVFYPYPQPWGVLLVPALVAGAVLVAVTALTLRAFPRRPYVAFGWLWYLVTLVPVIGLVQAGAQARADRYTYVPMIGLSIALVWGASGALERWPRLRLALAAAACCACVVLTSMQLRYWRDSTALYGRAIAVTRENYLARFNLALLLDARGDTSQAVQEPQETVRIRPYFAVAHAELGQLLAKQGRNEEAVRALRTALRLRPGSADAHLRLGSVLGALGRNEEAAAECSRALQLEPENADAHYDLGIALAQSGKFADAVREFSIVVRLRPADGEARQSLEQAQRLAAAK
ncbi:MAG TPA: tetratricopeptide repeat protein [Candidatus Acidoferrales bacterium]|nr:tetratricopeptide repeat protein [Candidatus Acidoferrales bacterium]